MEGADSEPGQRQQMSTADAAETRNGDAFAAQRLLLRLRSPSRCCGKTPGRSRSGLAQCSLRCSIAGSALRLSRIIYAGGSGSAWCPVAADNSAARLMPGAGSDSVQSTWLDYLNAFRNVMRQYRRSLFGISAVAFGVTALTLAAGFIEWIFWATREGTIQTGLGHIHVMRPGYLEAGTGRSAEISAAGCRLPSEALGELSAWCACRAAAGLQRPDQPRRSNDLVYRRGGSPGTRARRQPQGAHPGGTVSSRRRTARASCSGWGLARNLGVKVGEKVVLLGNTASGRHQRGRMHRPRPVYDGQQSLRRLRAACAVADRATAFAHLRHPSLDRAAGRYLRTPTRTLASAARRNFADSGVEFVPWYDLADFYNKVVALLSTQIGVVQFDHRDHHPSQHLEHHDDERARADHRNRHLHGASAADSAQILRQFVYRRD